MKKRLLAALLSLVLVLAIALPVTLAENLRTGSTGSQVTQAQTRLSELGYYKAKVDGKFGYSTYLAVRDFQVKNALKVDGVLGEQTNLALFSTSAIKKDGKTAGVATYQRIAYGSEGPAVKTVQGILRDLKFYTDDVEGRFGYATTQAVRAFQQAYGLKVDGVVGPLTWAALLGAGEVPGVPTPKPTAQPPLRLTSGSTGEAVKQVQQQLKNLNYYNGKVDGLYGYGTLQAVRAFQKANKLSVDGVVGPATWAKLFGTGPIGITTLPPPLVIPTPEPGPAKPAPVRVQWLDKGEIVGQVQQRLIALGYLNTNVVDYIYGFATYEAVRAFQKVNGLNNDGIVGPLTWNVLFSAEALPKPTPTPKP